MTRLVLMLMAYFLVLPILYFFPFGLTVTGSFGLLGIALLIAGGSVLIEPYVPLWQNLLACLLLLTAAAYFVFKYIGHKVIAGAGIKDDVDEDWFAAEELEAHTEEKRPEKERLIEEPPPKPELFAVNRMETVEQLDQEVEPLSINNEKDEREAERLDQEEELTYMDSPWEDALETKESVNEESIIDEKEKVLADDLESFLAREEELPAADAQEAAEEKAEAESDDDDKYYLESLFDEIEEEENDGFSTGEEEETIKKPSVKDRDENEEAGYIAPFDHLEFAELFGTEESDGSEESEAAMETIAAEEVSIAREDMSEAEEEAEISSGQADFLETLEEGELFAAEETAEESKWNELLNEAEEPATEAEEKQDEPVEAAAPPVLAFADGTDEQEAAVSEAEEPEEELVEQDKADESAFPEKNSERAEETEVEHLEEAEDSDAEPSENGETDGGQEDGLFVPFSDEAAAVGSEEERAVEAAAEEELEAEEKEPLSREWLQMITSELELKKELLSFAEAEEAMKGYLRAPLHDRDYYTFAKMLLSFYIEQGAFEKAAKWTTELEERLSAYPFIISELQLIKGYIDAKINEDRWK